MANEINPISSSTLNSLLSSGSTDPLSSLLGGTSGFDSIFSQAINQAQTPAEKLQDAFLEVQYDDMNALYNAFSGGSSSDSFLAATNTMSNVLGSVSAQVNQLEQALGMAPATTDTSAASNTNAALGLETQMLLNNDLAGLGTGAGSGLDALA